MQELQSAGEERRFLPQLFSPVIRKDLFRSAFVFKHKVKTKLCLKCDLKGFENNTQQKSAPRLEC